MIHPLVRGVPDSDSPIIACLDPLWSDVAARSCDLGRIEVWFALLSGEEQRLWYDDSDLETQTLLME
jgi:hypothetical protein